MATYGPPELRRSGAGRQAWGALGALLLALALTVIPEPAQQAIATALRDSVLRPFLGLQESLVRRRVLAVEVGVLRQNLDSVIVELVSRSTLEEENDRLRGLLGLEARLGPGYTASAVARSGTPGSESMFLLDVGADAEVRPRAPVITREGLAGVVRTVEKDRSVGMDWTHPEFRASAMTLDGLTYGIVEPRRGDFREADRLMLTRTPFNTTLKPGAVIVTSGLGGVFPRGIPIGRIRELAEAEGGWRKSYWIEPFVNVGSLTHVLVMAGPPSSLAPDVSRGWPAGPDSLASPGESPPRPGGGR